MTAKAPRGSASYHASRPLEQFDLSGALTELTEIIRRYHILLPAGVAMLLKVLVMLEGTARQLSPSFNLMELMEPFQDQMMRDRLKPQRWLAKWRRTLERDWSKIRVETVEAKGADPMQVGGQLEVQARVNLETMQADGSVRSSGGVISVYEPPAGRGVLR